MRTTGRLTTSVILAVDTVHWSGHWLSTQRWAVSIGVPDQNLVGDSPISFSANVQKYRKTASFIGLLHRDILTARHAAAFGSIPATTGRVPSESPYAA